MSDFSQIPGGRRPNSRPRHSVGPAENLAGCSSPGQEELTQPNLELSALPALPRRRSARRGLARPIEAAPLTAEHMNERHRTAAAQADGLAASEV